MKVKFFSDDNKEFSSEQLCIKYEEALRELKSGLNNRDNKIQTRYVEKTKWHLIKDELDFFFYDHKDDSVSRKSPRTLYDIFKIIEQSKISFPFWLSEDEKGNPFNLDSRLQYLQNLVQQLETQVNKHKIEIMELETLRDDFSEHLTTEEDEENLKPSEATVFNNPVVEEEAEDDDNIEEEIEDV